MANSIIPVKVEFKPGEILSNLDGVAASVKEYCNDYRNVVVTEETVADGKQMLANIRKQKKYLDDQRKEIKKAWNGPYLEFEKKVKEVIGIYDEPIGLINTQIQELEEQRRDKKRESITEIWENAEIPQEISGWFSLEELYNPRWENATYKESDIEKDINDSLANLQAAVQTIKAMDSPYEPEGMQALKATKSLAYALKRMTDLQEQEKVIERRKEENKNQESVPEEPQQAYEGFYMPEDKIYEVTVNVSADGLLELQAMLDKAGYFYVVKEVCK